MLAQCPHCGTVFAVTTAQLGAASGRVRCGACRRPFDASQSLTEGLPEVTGESAPASPTPAEPAQPVEVPEPLRPDLSAIIRRRRPWYVRAAGLALSLALAALLAFQYAWLEPVDLLARVPAAAPWVESLAPWFESASATLGWTRPAPRDLSRIRVVERDIRDHPQHSGALLVHARLVNDAPFAQLAPQVRLTLFDVNGAVVAQRVFAPAEYSLAADPSLPLERGSALQLRLELQAPTTPAMSYQIEFL